MKKLNGNNITALLCALCAIIDANNLQGYIAAFFAFAAGVFATVSVMRHE